MLAPAEIQLDALVNTTVREVFVKEGIAAAVKKTDPGGWVFFSTINRNPKSFLFAIVGAEHVLKLLPKGTHEYARFIRPSELGRWCRDAGLVPASSSG